MHRGRPCATLLTRKGSVAAGHSPRYHIQGTIVWAMPSQDVYHRQYRGKKRELSRGSGQAALVLSAIEVACRRMQVKDLTTDTR